MGTLNLYNNAGAGDTITVSDAGNNNTLDVTPTTGASATSQISGQTPVVNTTSAGALFADLVGSSDQLVVNGSQYDDTIAVNGAAASVAISNATQGTLQKVDYSGTASLTVNGNDGSDMFNVTPSATMPIFIDGGNPVGVQPGDALDILGGGPVEYFPGPTGDSGAFITGTNAAVSFAHIESFDPIDAGFTPVLINGTNGDDDFQVTAIGQYEATVSVNAAPTMTFYDMTDGLYLDGLAGDDEFNITGPTAEVNWDVNVYVAGDTHAANSGNVDVLSFNTPSAGTVTYTPTGADAGTVLFDQGGGNTSTITMGAFTIPSLDYTSSPGGVNRLTLNGGAQDDALVVQGTGNDDDSIVYTPGSASDAGMLAVNSLLPIAFNNLGSAATTSVTDTGTGNTLVVNGTAADDVFTVAGTTGDVQLNSQIPLAPTGIQTLTLNGLAGDNGYTIDAPQPYSVINVNGSGLSDPDVLTVNADDSDEVDVALNGDTTGYLFGGGLATVNFMGVGTVNVYNYNSDGEFGATVAVGDFGSNNALNVTPTGANAATSQISGLAPLVNTTSAGALSALFSAAATS